MLGAPLSRTSSGSVGSTVEVSEIESLALGSLIVGDGSGAPSELSVGSNGAFLQALSSEATGTIWRTSPQLIDSIDWTTGVAVDPTAYQILRDNATNNRLHLNAPALRQIELSIGGQPLMLVSSTIVSFTQDIDLVGDMHADNTIYFKERSGDPSSFGDEGGIYTKEVGGVTELHYIDSSGNVTQFSSGGLPSVIGPASSTDNAIVRWDGVLGAAIQDYTSGAPTISDTGAITATQGGSLTGTWSDLGSVTTIDINGGTLDGVTIGGSVAGAITGTAITATSFVIGANTLTTTEWAFLDGQDQSVFTTSSPTFVNLTITSFAANWTNAGRTVADLGIVTTVDINGGSVDGVIIGAASAAAGTFTDIVATSLDLNGALDLDVAALGATITNTADVASSQVMILEGDRATMVDDDEAYLSMRLSNDAGTQLEFARITWVATDVNVTTDEDGRLDFAVRTADVLANELSLTGAGLYPSVSGGLSLGISGTTFGNVYLSSGSVIDFAGGDVTWTHTAGTMTFSGDLAGTNANSGQFLGEAAASATVPTFAPNKTDTNSGIGANGADQLSLIAGGIEIMRLTEGLTGVTAITVTQQAGTSGAPTALLLTGGAHTAITAATESNGINLDFSATKTWAAGAGPLASQREILIKAPTYNGDVAGALTITNAYTVYIDGAPVQGTNITLSNRFALGLGAGMIAAGDIVVSNANGSAMFNAAASGTVPTLAPDRSDSDTGIGTAGADQLSLIAGGVEIVNLTEAGASGNTLTLAGGTLTSGGTDDATIDLSVTLNDTGVAGGSDVFRLIKGNITATDTTGWDDVYLLDLQIGAASRFQYSSASVLQLSSSGAGSAKILLEAQGASNNTAGRPFSLAAGDAGSLTTGAAGGDFSIDGGAAGGTDGNNGGNINLTGGVPTGAGQAGVVNINQPGGTPGTDTLGITHNGTDAVLVNLDTGVIQLGIGAGNSHFTVGSATSTILHATAPTLTFSDTGDGDTASLRVQTETTLADVGKAILQDVNGLVIIINETDGTVGMFEFDTVNNAVVEISDVSTTYTTTEDNDTTVNVYWDVANAQFELNNELGAAKTFKIFYLAA